LVAVEEGWALWAGLIGVLGKLWKDVNEVSVPYAMVIILSSEVLD
jgi:hypothetical protein